MYVLLKFCEWVELGDVGLREGAGWVLCISGGDWAIRSLSLGILPIESA